MSDVKIGTNFGNIESHGERLIFKILEEFGIDTANVNISVSEELNINSEKLNIILNNELKITTDIVNIIANELNLDLNSLTINGEDISVTTNNFAITTDILDLKVNKLAIANDDDELIDLMIQLAQAVVNTDTAAAEEIKTKLEGFKQ